MLHKALQCRPSLAGQRTQPLAHTAQHLPAGDGSYLATFSLSTAGQYGLYAGVVMPAGPVTQVLKWGLTVLPAAPSAAASSVAGLAQIPVSGLAHLTAF